MISKAEILAKCEALEEKGSIEEVLHILDGYCSDECNDPDIHYYYGRLLKKQARFGDALNAYNRALSLDPDHKKAKAAIFLVKSILNIENNLYFENPYTDDDLYDL